MVVFLTVMCYNKFIVSMNLGLYRCFLLDSYPDNQQSAKSKNMTKDHPSI